jgi:hypothetical protein
VVTLTPRRACGLAFATAFATLFAQVIVHRMVSAKLVNNLAFLVLSLTMLGFAFSGVALTRWRERLRAFPGFGLSLMIVSGLFYRASIERVPPSWASDRAAFLVSLVYCLPAAMLYAIPFAFCGIILGALLSSADLPTRRVYFFDLVGSAGGACAVIPAISGLGVERGAVLAGAVLLVAAWVAVPPRRLAARLLGAACAAALVVAAWIPARVFDMR